MPKKFLANVLLLLTANFLIKPFWILGIDRTVQNTVGNEQYGQYMVMFNMALMFTMVLDFGINNYTSTFIAKHQQLLHKKFAALFPLKLLFSGVYVALTMLLGVVYGFNAKFMLLLFAFSINQVLLFFLLFFRANISGLQWFKTEAFLSVIDRALMIIVVGGLLLTFTNAFTITQFIVAQTISYAVAALVAFLVLLKPLKKFYIKFDKRMMLVMIRKSWPYALLALLMTVYMRSDYLIMKKLLPNGDEQNGIYAIANRLMEAANMMAAIVAGVLLPLFSNMLKKRENVTEIVKFGMLLLIIPSVCVAAIAWFYNVDIMLLINKTSPHLAAPVFKIVMISFVAMCTMYIFGTLLTANGNMKVLNTLAAIAVVINVVLNLLLLPKYGALGAAIAMACTHGFIAVSNAIFAQIRLKLTINVSYIIRFLAVLMACVLCVGVCYQQQISFWLASVCAASAAILMLWITRLLQISELKQVIKPKV